MVVPERALFEGMGRGERGGGEGGRGVAHAMAMLERWGKEGDEGCIGRISSDVGGSEMVDGKYNTGLALC